MAARAPDHDRHTLFIRISAGTVSATQCFALDGGDKYAMVATGGRFLWYYTY